MTIQDAHNKYCKEALELMMCKNADYSGAIDNNWPNRRLCKGIRQGGSLQFLGHG